MYSFCYPVPAWPYNPKQSLVPSASAWSAEHGTAAPRGSVHRLQQTIDRPSFLLTSPRAQRPGQFIERPSSLQIVTCHSLKRTVDKPCISVSLSPSIHFNGHFPGGPGLAGLRMSPFWSPRMSPFWSPRMSPFWSPRMSPFWSLVRVPGLSE